MEKHLFSKAGRTFADHPKFRGVRFAPLVSSKDSGTVSVSVLEIGFGIEIPVHTHDPQVDSIFVVEGEGEAYVNGRWETVTEGDYVFVPAGVEHGIRNTGRSTLTLFVHHAPPLF